MTIVTTIGSMPGTAGAQESLTLAKALEIGRTRAPELVAAKSRLESANANAAGEKAGYMPTLTAALQGQVIAVRDAQVVPPNTNGVTPSVLYTEAASATASFRWNVWDFGKTSNAVAAADAQASAANTNLDATNVQLASDIASAYVTFYFREELRAAAIQTVQNREKLLTMAKGLVKSGLQPPVEEIRSAARLEAAKRDLAGAEADALDARANLATILRLDAPFKVSEPHLPSVEADVSRAARAAEDKRETVRAARATVDARRAATDAARARYLPTLSVNGDATYRFAQTDRFDVLTNTRTLVGAVVLSGPLFDYSIPTGVDQANADAAAAEAVLSQTTRDARGEGIRAAIAVRASDNVLEHAKKATEAAGAVFTIIQARYAQGLSTPLEVIDAETQDVNARTDKVSAELSRSLAVIRLLLATGQGTRLYQESR